MALDFRASQFRGAKFISSGSTGTGATLLFYPIGADSTTNPNTGVINTTKFGTGSIGNDIFLFVSGGVGRKGVSGSQAISVFGGDVHISGNLTLDGTGGGGTNYWFSTSSNVIFTTGSLELSGNITFTPQSGSTVGKYISVLALANGTNFPVQGRSLRIEGSTAVLSGAGGDVTVIGGNGGIGTTSIFPGGSVNLYGGNGGESYLNQSSGGGSININGGPGADANTNNVSSGPGGGITLSAGFGGIPNNVTGSGGSGGNISLIAGDAQTYTDPTNSGSGGQGGVLSLQAGAGANAVHGDGGQGGQINISAGTGGYSISGSTGAGGTLTLFAGGGAFSGTAFTGKTGDMGLYGGFLSNKDSAFYTSGSFLAFGDHLISGGTQAFSRVTFNGNPTVGGTRFAGKDIFFFVSGSVGTKNVAGPASSGSIVAFGGDLFVSGNAYVTRSLYVGDFDTSVVNNTNAFYVSGTINKTPQGTPQRNAVFNADMIVSGTILMRSSANNPMNFIINGNNDGGIVFSGSLLTIGASGNTSANHMSVFQIGALVSGNPQAVNNQDVVFFASGNVGGKNSSGGAVSLFGGDLVVSGNFYGLNSASFSSTVVVPTPTTGTAAANKDYVDMPTVRVVAGATDTLLVTDFGKVIAYTLSSSIVINLNNSLTASFPANKEAMILMQFEHSASIPIISASGGATLNGATTVYTGSVGYGFISIGSRDGLNWFR